MSYNVLLCPTLSHYVPLCPTMTYSVPLWPTLSSVPTMSHYVLLCPEVSFDFYWGEFSFFSESKLDALRWAFIFSDSKLNSVSRALLRWALIFFLNPSSTHWGELWFFVWIQAQLSESSFPEVSFDFSFESKLDALRWALIFFLNPSST